MEAVTFVGELSSPREISPTMRERWLDHYLGHREDGCAGYHSCPDFRRQRERWAMGQVEYQFDDDSGQWQATRPTTCPECGGGLVERTSRRTGDAFIGCSNYPECKYIYRARKA